MSTKDERESRARQLRAKEEHLKRLSSEISPVHPRSSHESDLDERQPPSDSAAQAKHREKIRRWRFGLSCLVIATLTAALGALFADELNRRTFQLGAFLQALVGAYFVDKSGVLKRLEKDPNDDNSGSN